jgi:hypothetical protein
MAVTPAGFLSLPLHYLRKSVAASSTFQTLTEAEDAAAAEEFVFIGAAKDDGTEDPPRITLRYFDSMPLLQTALNRWQMRGQAELTLEMLVDGDLNGDPEDEYLDLTNTFGAILKEITALANTGGYLTIQSAEISQIGWIPQENNNGNLWLQGSASVGFVAESQ